MNESTRTVRDVGLLFEENRKGIDEVIAKLASLEDAATTLMVQLNSAVSENRQPLNATLNNLQIITDEAAARIEELADSLSTTLKHLEETGANASDLMDDQRLTIEEILTNLQETTRNLSRLVTDPGGPTERGDPRCQASGPQERRTEMKAKGLVVAALFNLTACASAPKIDYYTLDMAPSGNARSDADIVVERLQPPRP